MTTSSRRLSIKEEQRLLTRNRLIDAARTVFEREGYHGASIGAIAEEAGLNRATFYLHFTGRSEVFVGVWNSWFDETSVYWRRLDDALMVGTVDAMEAWLDDGLSWWEQHAAILPAWHQALDVDLEVAALWKTRMDKFSEELPNFLESQPAEEREDARLRILMLMVQLDIMCYRWIVQKVLVIDRDRFVKVMAEMWVDSLQLRPS